MVDLTDKLTVFIINGGKNPNYDVCLQALKNQTCKFKLDIIQDIAPMSKAFQEMLDRCTTEYFIQVDNDMVLQQNSIEHMYKFFEGNQSSEKIIMDCYLLRDSHLNMEIYGIKIYKANIFKKYPFNLENPSCEVEQLDRMKKDGYEIRFQKEIMGEHSPHWTNELIFERYYNLMCKFTLFRYVWLEKLPKKLWEMLKNDPSEINMHAYAGALAGIFTKTPIEEEKDYRKTREEYGKLLSFFDQPHQCTLYLTSQCNFKCTWCYRQHGLIEEAPDLTPIMVETIMFKFPNIKGYCICGFGDPLMSPNLVPVLQKLKSGGKFIGLITNGSLLNSRFNEIAGWHRPDYISVSLNAHNKEEHERTTGTKTWDNVLIGIKRVADSNIPIYVSSVVTKQNIKNVPELLKLVKSLGVKTVHLHNLLPHMDIVQNTTFWDEVLQTEDAPLIEQLKQLPEADIIKGYPILIDKSGGKNACDFAWYSLAVNGNGSISYCNSVLPCDKKYGNINDFVVWNSEQAQKFRKDFCNKKLPHCALCFRNWRVR